MSAKNEEFVTAARATGASRARIVKKGLLIRSQLRLFIPGFFVYIALVFFQANPIALAVGLSSALIIIPVSLISRG